MAVTSTEQERYCPWLAMMGAAAVQLDEDLIAYRVREYILTQELGGEMVVSTNKPCEFELGTTKPIWPQYRGSAVPAWSGRWTNGCKR